MGKRAVGWKCGHCGELIPMEFLYHYHSPKFESPKGPAVIGVVEFGMTYRGTPADIQWEWIDDSRA